MLPVWWLVPESLRLQRPYLLDPLQPVNAGLCHLQIKAYEAQQAHFLAIGPLGIATDQINQALCPLRRLCCTHRVKDSPHESRMIAGSYEQLVPHKAHDNKLVVIQ